MGFENKVVVVTGGSSGIGAETAIQFARQSAKVVIVGRNEVKLQNVAKACEEAGSKPLVIKADLTIDSEVRSIVDQTIKHFGHIDILVNNAGILSESNVQEGVDTFDRLMRTNVRSVYLLTSVAAPHLINTRGNIINISSVAGQKVVPGLLAYCVTKAALDMFTKSLARELSVHGIRVNGISPGPVKTDIFENAGIDGEAYISNRTSTSILGKIAVPKDIADLVVFLAGDQGNSITGSIYVVDNGRLVE